MSADINDRVLAVDGLVRVGNRFGRVRVDAVATKALYHIVGY